MDPAGAARKIEEALGRLAELGTMKREIGNHIKAQQAHREKLDRVENGPRTSLLEAGRMLAPDMGWKIAS